MPCSAAGSVVAIDSLFDHRHRLLVQGTCPLEYKREAGPCQALTLTATSTLPSQPRSRASGG
jgi:hypothetical protein